MGDDNAPRQYRIWGADNVAYGPVELPTVAHWINDERVLPDSWIYCSTENVWSKASDWPELKSLFPVQPAETLESSTDARPNPTTPGGLKPGTLRRLRLFADMEERQIESFVSYMEVVVLKPFAHIVRKGDIGDAMYLILEGELRAYVVVDGKECTLSTMTIGEFFGEVSLLDQGPRSANVVANKDCVLLKVSSPRMEHLLREAPGLATPFLYALSRSVVNRVRILTNRYQDSLHFLRTLGASH